MIKFKMQFFFKQKKKEKKEKKWLMSRGQGAETSLDFLQRI